MPVLERLLKAAAAEDIGHDVTSGVTSVPNHKLGAGAGFEPAHRVLQACAQLVASVNAETADTQLRTQKLAELRELIEAWPKLSAEMRAAVLAVTRAAR